VLFGTKKIGIYSLVWGALVGACLQFMFQFFKMYKLNKCRKFKFDLMHNQIIKVLVLSLPLLGVMVIYQINQVIMRVFASTLEEGSIAALNYAYQLINVPLSILAFSIGTAMFPDMSDKISQGNQDSARKLFSTSIRMTIFLMIPMSVGFGLISHPLIKLIFERGSFTAMSTLITSRCFFFYTLGLFAMAVNTICIRVFYALKDMVTPLKVGALGVIINIVLAFFLKRFLGVAGLALAFALYVIISSIILLVLLDVKVNMIKLKEMVIPITQILIVSLVMALSVLLAYRYSNLIISVITGIVVFIASSFIMKMEEIFRLKELFISLRSSNHIKNTL
jgi:putative peptidoglycan lipid II flippase